MRRDGLSVLKACSYIFYLKWAFVSHVTGEIPPCQTPMCGVAYSCSYVLLMPSKLLGCIGFLYKVVHKTGRFSVFIFTVFFSF